MSAIRLENSLISRKMTDAMALRPLLIVSESELDEFVAILSHSLDELSERAHRLNA